MYAQSNLAVTADGPNEAMVRYAALWDLCDREITTIRQSV